MSLKFVINNNKYCYVGGDNEDLLNLKKYLSFYQPGYEYSPAYQNGYWNGLVSLINKDNYFSLGLLNNIIIFLNENKIEFEVIDHRTPVEKVAPLSINSKLEQLGKIPRQYQIDTVNELMKVDRGIAKLSTGAGKCSSYDSLHITQQGMLNYLELLEDIKLNPKELVNIETNLATPLLDSKIDRSNQIYRDGISKSIKITNELGFELIATPEHKIKIVDNDGIFKWKSFKDLKIGDYTVVAPGTQIFGNLNIDLDDAYWYGLLLGDGGLTRKSQVRLTNADDYILNFVKFYLKTKNITYVEYKKNSSKVVTICIHSTKYRKELFDLGFDYCKSTHKTLPIFIRKLSKQSLAMVIRGLYETDGWIGKGGNRPSIEIGLSNKKLVNQLHLILLNFGIIAHRRVKKTYREDSHILSIYKDYIDIFCKEIGFAPDSRKFEELQVELTKYNANTTNTNVNIVPNQAENIKKLVKNQKWKHRVWDDCPIKRNTITSWYCSYRQPSKQNLKLFLNWHKFKYGDNELNRNMLRLCENDLFFSKIKKIEEIESDNYDFVIPNTHSFVSQGYINHNTLISGLLTAAINKPTLILVISLDLLEQFHSLFSTIFEEPIGRIGDGQANVERITIATLWTVAKSLGIKDKDLIEDTEGYKEKFNENNSDKINKLIKTAKVVIFDECHLASCSSLQKLYGELGAEHFYGFSATPKKDGDDAILVNAVFGDVKINVPASKLINEGYLVKPIIKFLTMPKRRIESKNYAGIYKEFIVENEFRNNTIVDCAKKFIENKYKTLILFKIINHGKILYELCLEKSIKCALLSGNDNLEKREEIKKQLTNGEIDLIIASTIFECGVDIPCLSALILASGGKSSVKTLQRVGRVLRPFPGKSHCKILDFYDDVKYLKNHSKTRMKIYQEEPGFEVIAPKFLK